MEAECFPNGLIKVIKSYFCIGRPRLSWSPLISWQFDSTTKYKKTAQIIDMMSVLFLLFPAHKLFGCRCNQLRCLFMGGFGWMPEGSDTVIFLVLQWKLQILDGYVLVFLRELLYRMLYRGTECLVHGAQHT